MEIDKMSWLIHELTSWTSVLELGLDQEITRNKYLFLPLIKHTIKVENIHTTERLHCENDPDEYPPEVQMLVDQLNKQVSFEELFQEGLKPRVFYVIQYGTDLYNFLDEVYEGQENMDHTLKADGWFKPGKQAAEHGITHVLCNSYWKIPEVDENNFEEVLEDLLPDKLYNRMEISVKVK